MWYHNGAFYLGTDSGCSCGYAWESYTDDELTGPLTAEQAIEEVTSLTAVDSGYDSYDQDDIDELVEAIRAWR